MSKGDPLPSAPVNANSQFKPAYRIGDLVWCQEAKNPKLWWPAMVTYDPHAGIFFRTTKCSQYHVQYFGISAIRGWVSAKSCVALNTGEEKPFIRKGLSKKIKSEYEVAVQEVAEAAKLDYKQRKLKFIFSFGPSNKGGKQVKQESTKEMAVQVKVEPNGDADSGAAVDKEPGTSQKKPSGSALERKSSLSDLDAEELSRRSSGRVKKARKTSESSSTDDKHKSKGGGALSVTKGKDTGPTVADPGVPTNGHRDGDQDKQAPKVCPPRLHSEHSSKSKRRRSRSESSNPLDCERCLEYITSCDGVELKCNSKPEIFSDPAVESGAQPIRMYFQNQYGDSGDLKRPALSKASVPPNLNCKALTKGMSTKNVSTDLLPGSAKQSHPSVKLDRRGKPGSSCGRSGSSSPVLSAFHSSNDSVSSESGYETGKSASKKRRRRVTSTSALGSSPLLEVCTSATEESVTRKRKRERSLSPNSVQVDAAVDGAEEDQILSADDEAAPIKRVRRSSAKYAQPLPTYNAEKSRRSSMTLKNAASDSTSAADPTNDSSSEVSIVSQAASLPTPAIFSLEPPSMDFEVASPVAEGSGGVQSSCLTAKEKLKQSLLIADSKLGVCSICDCEGSDLMCQGHCMSSFHMDCLGLMVKPSFKFVCDECLISCGTCFVCGKGQGEVKKCNKPKCSKLYHPECIEGNKLFQRGKSPSFTCPLHVCARCTSIGVSTINHSNLLQCVKCPLALHKPDCLVAGCEVIDQSRMLCYQHVKISKSTKLYSHINLNTCLECGAIGSLYCCDVCSAAYHLECLDQDARPSSDTHHWKCPSCAVHDLPTYGSLVITKFGVWRWWPSEVVLPEDIPDNILAKKPGDCMFVVRFCGSRDFCWTYHGRVLPYTEEAELEGMRGHKKPKASDHYKKACEEAKEIHSTRRKVLEAKEVARQNCKFYTKIRTNKYLVPRPHLDHESLDFLPCQCTSESPCKEDSMCVNRAIHIECNPKNCPVADLCQNQRMQRCQNAKTELFFTGDRGWGLKATTDLSAGDFMIEYVGEVLDEAMCQERLKKAHTQNANNFYMLTLDAGLVIDAGQKSNRARFINHSCGPNCETQKWRVRGEPRIGIFACKSIPTGTELTFDYQLDSLGNEKKKCFCGSKNCSGFLGLRSLKVVSDEEAKAKLKVKKKKKSKPRQPVKKEEAAEDEEDRHDDECFICKDGGELLLCDRKSCCRAYHLQCINRKVFPPKSQRWECPWHFCGKCQKLAVSFCSTCPVSFCSKHMKDSLSTLQGSNILQCQNCLPSSVITSCKPESAAKEEGIAEKEEARPEKVKSPSAPPVDPLVPPQKKVASASSSTTSERTNNKKSRSPLESMGAVWSPLEPPKDKPRPSPQLLGLLEKSPVPRPLVIDGPPQVQAVGSPLDNVCASPPILKYPSSEPAVEYHKDSVPPQMAANVNTLPSRIHEAHRSPTSAFRALNRPPLFQPQSPTFGQSYPMPVPAESHSAKLPEGYVDFSAHAAGFQQPQQPPIYNSFIPPVWFMPRNGFVNSLDPAAAAASGFGYPTYPSALINPNPLGFPYFGEPIPNLGMHHQQPLPSTSAIPPTTTSSSSSSAASPSFLPPTLPPTHPQNGGFLAWKYC